MNIYNYINEYNWFKIKDILPDITVIKSLNLSNIRLSEFPKMSHITINGDFWCYNNKLTSFKGCPIVKGDFNCTDNYLTSFEYCPIINGSFYCYNNQITSFKDCPDIGGKLYSDFEIFNKIHEYSKEKKISLLDAQVELYNQQNKELLEHIDKFPDLVAYIRLKELNKLL